MNTSICKKTRRSSRCRLMKNHGILGDLALTPVVKIYPLQPGRLEPRVIKRQKKEFPYMTVPRAQLNLQLRARHREAFTMSDQPSDLNPPVLSERSESNGKLPASPSSETQPESSPVR